MSTYRKPFVGADRWITVFADASYCPETGAWGYGWWLKYGQPARTLYGEGGGLSIAGSNEAEVVALERALEAVDSLSGQYLLQGKMLVVQSDCTGAIDRIQSRLRDMQREHGFAKAYTKHVKGHRGHVDPRASVNTGCDRAAGRQMRKYREQVRAVVPTTFD